MRKRQEIRRGVLGVWAEQLKVGVVTTKTGVTEGGVHFFW